LPFHLQLMRLWRIQHLEPGISDLTKRSPHYQIVSFWGAHRWLLFLKLLWQLFQAQEFCITHHPSFFSSQIYFHPTLELLSFLKQPFAHFTDSTATLQSFWSFTGSEDLSQ
jgi:hypothetical protein